MKRIILAVFLAFFVKLTPAAILDAPVPVNAYITQGGLDWAWAAPCPHPAAGCGIGGPMVDLSFQGPLGWRFPTPAELLLAPLAADFVFDGANVPLGGVDPVSGASFAGATPDLDDDAACASPYFGTFYSHCDFSNGRGQAGFSHWAGGPDAGDSPSFIPFREQLVVRDAAAAAPEPGTLALLGLGLAAFGLRRRLKLA